MTEPINITADVQYLARALARRDARHYGAEDAEGIIHPTWKELGEIGQTEYIKDAGFAAQVLIGIRGYQPGGLNA